MWPASRRGSVTVPPTPDAGHSCCAVSAERISHRPAAVEPAGPPRADGIGGLPGGGFLLGRDGPRAAPEDGDGPVHRVRVPPFLSSPTAVSNAEFAESVEATGYRTDAERFDWSFVFGGL